jgi:hypothetical protein
LWRLHQQPTTSVGCGPFATGCICDRRLHDAATNDIDDDYDDDDHEHNILLMSLTKEVDDHEEDKGGCVMMILA